MSDDTDIAAVLGKLTADERRIWQQIKAERAAGADVERLAGMERQAGGIKRSIREIVRREYEASGMTEEQAKGRGRSRDR